MDPEDSSNVSDCDWLSEWSYVERIETRGVIVSQSDKWDMAIGDHGSCEEDAAMAPRVLLDAPVVTRKNGESDAAADEEQRALGTELRPIGRVLGDTLSGSEESKAEYLHASAENEGRETTNGEGDESHKADRDEPEKRADDSEQAHTLDEKSGTMDTERPEDREELERTIQDSEQNTHQVDEQMGARANQETETEDERPLAEEDNGIPDIEHILQDEDEQAASPREGLQRFQEEHAREIEVLQQRIRDLEQHNRGLGQRNRDLEQHIRDLGRRDNTKRDSPDHVNEKSTRRPRDGISSQRRGSKAETLKRGRTPLPETKTIQMLDSVNWAFVFLGVCTLVFFVAVVPFDH